MGTGIYVDDIDQKFKRNLLWGISKLIALTGTLALVSWLVGQSILRQLGGGPKEGIAIMRRVAEGDLQIRIAEAPAGSMLASLDQMIQGLHRVMSQVHDASGLLSQQAAQIASSSHEISLASDRQADSTTSMAAAMEELTVSITHISDSTNITEQASRQATELAEIGVTQVSSATSAIENISTRVTQATGQIRQLDTKAREISSIAAVIKEIAGQTNLLALNAAI